MASASEAGPAAASVLAYPESAHRFGPAPPSLSPQRILLKAPNRGPIRQTHVLSVSAVSFSGVDHRVRCKPAAESFAQQTQPESLYERFIGRTSNYKSLTKDSVQGWAGCEDADANGMKSIKEVKL